MYENKIGQNFRDIINQAEAISFYNCKTILRLQRVSKSTLLAIGNAVFQGNCENKQDDNSLCCFKLKIKTVDVHETPNGD